MRGDVRSRRIAVVPDRVLNPPPGEHDHLADLARGGWGVIALWPPGIPEDVSNGWLDSVVDQVTTFLDDGYEVALFPAGHDPEIRRLVTALDTAGRTIGGVVDLVDTPGPTP